MRKIRFTTIVSDMYLYKFIVLYETLKHHSHDFILHALFVDENSYNIAIALKLEYVQCQLVRKIEDDKLKLAKENRSKHEYAWTLKSFWLNKIIKKYNDCLYFAHIDSDIAFFKDPISIFNENTEASLYLTDHNNSKKFLYTYNLTGKYNTGFVGCKKNETSMNAVNWWYERCLNWCYKEQDTLNKLYGDQRHVEHWENLYDGVHIVESIGANVAIWNHENYSINIKNDKVFVDNEELIFYHYSGLNIFNSNEFLLTWFDYVEDKTIEYIYVPYLILLNNTINKIQSINSSFRGFASKNSYRGGYYYMLK